MFLLGLAAAFLGGAAQAAEPSARIKNMTVICMSCHGSSDMLLGGIHAPKIVGQRVKYIVASLNAYRSGDRANAFMTPQAKMLSDSDIKEIAAYFGGPPWTQPGPPHAGGEAIKTPQMVIDYCGSCHTEGGSGTMPEIPVIAGQHPDYLEYTLNQYRNGERKSLIMSPYAKKLSAADTKELAAHFSRYPGLKLSGDQ
jgi:cytochrome c553